MGVIEKEKLSKICEFCGEIFYQKEKQSPNKFYKQKFCSRSCNSKNTNSLPHVIESRHKKRTPDKTLQNKKCIICGEIFYRPHNYSNPSWKRKKTCSKDCHNKFLSNERTGKALGIRASKIVPCFTCGKDVIVSNYKLEKFKTFYCSRYCASKNPTVIEKCKIMGNSNKGRKKTPEQIEQMKKSALKGENHPNWKGGVTYINRKGNYKNYKIKYVRCPDDFKEMSRKDGYVMEHRLLVAQELKRSLKRSECVHHIDHDPENNNIENLMLFRTNSDHKKYESGNLNIKPLWEFMNEQKI